MFKQQLSGLAAIGLCAIASLAFAGTPDARDQSSMTMPGHMQQPMAHDQASSHSMMKHGNGYTSEHMHDLMTKETSENQALAHKMMGHINLAQLALDLKLPQDAANQVERARGIEETLAARMPEWNFDTSFEYGKVAYDDESMMTDHYIPVIDDVFLVSDYQTIFKHAKAVDVNALSANALHLGVAVDLWEVRAALDKAATAIDAKNYTEARTTLADVFRNAIVDEEEVDDPKLLIAENLALAKAFTDEGQYDSARLTLKHVKDRIKQADKDEFSGIDQASLAKLSTELDQMQANLRKADPTLSQRVSDDLANWGERVSGWFS